MGQDRPPTGILSHISVVVRSEISIGTYKTDKRLYRPHHGFVLQRIDFYFAQFRKQAFADGAKANTVAARVDWSIFDM